MSDSNLPSVGRYPGSFRVFYKETKFGNGESTFVLGQTVDQPVIATTFKLNTFKKNHMTIYNGPTTADGTLATVEHESIFNRGSIIKILSPPSAIPVVEKMTAKYSSLTSSSFFFAVITGDGPDAFPEKYEWRQSQGPEIKATADGGFAYGWKLLRLGRDTHATGDNKEIVAVLVDATSLSSKVAKFQFYNSGATGRLGDVWADMAVVTALRLMQLRWFQDAA